MNRESNDQLIQLYLKGQLSDNEKSEFEQRLMEDPQLSEELELQRLEKQVKDELIARKLRGIMQDLDKKEPPVSGWQRFPGFLLLILIGLGTLFFVGKGWFSQHAEEQAFPKEEHLPNHSIPTTEEIETFQPGPERPIPKSPEKSEEPLFNNPSKSSKPKREIAMAYFKAPDLLTMSSMGAESGKESTESIRDANLYYQKGELAKAISIVDTLVSKNPDASFLHLLLGKLYFETGDFLKAIKTLQPISERRSLYASEARWNLLLAYLAAYEVYQEEFELLLDRIVADPQHFQHDAALKLREALK